MKICFITDGCGQFGGKSWFHSLERALKKANGAVEFVQLREFWLPKVKYNESKRFVLSLRDLARSYGAKCIANSSTPAELLDQLDGIHLNAESLNSYSFFRDDFPESFVVGYSAHSVSEALSVTKQHPGFNYLFLSPIFKPISKTSQRPILGTATLAKLCAATQCPVYALGGVTMENAADCIAAGAAGVAGISLVNADF